MNHKGVCRAAPGFARVAWLIADPSQYNSTKGQNAPIQQNVCKFLASDAVLISFYI